MIDTSRRVFLKGMMAAAAMPIVAPLLPMVSMAKEVAPLVSPSLLRFEPGDVWFHMNDAWEFIGKCNALAIPPAAKKFDPPSIGFPVTTRSFYADRQPPEPVKLQVFMEQEGYNAVSRHITAMIDGSWWGPMPYIDAVVSVAGANVVMTQAFVTSSQYAIERPLFDDKGKEIMRPIVADLTIAFSTFGKTTVAM